MCKVLLVDDDPQYRSAAKNILQLKFQLQITEAKNPQEALLKIKENEYDVIISDFNMPLLNGEQFFLEIRQQNIHTPFFMCTADILAQVSHLQNFPGLFKRYDKIHFLQMLEDTDFQKSIQWVQSAECRDANERNS